MIKKRMSEEAEVYADKLFPCEKPCDSWGVCDGCHERNCFEVGYNFGVRAAIEILEEKSK